MQLKNKTILIVSNEPWGDMWYSKHHWAFELSKHNKVYFVNPPKVWGLIDLFKTRIILEKYSSTLSVLKYNNRLPFKRFNLFFRINEWLIYKSFNKFLGNKKNIVFWTFDPVRLVQPSQLNSKLNIYYVADLFSFKYEDELANNSDYILSVNKTILDKYKKSQRIKLLVPHGIIKVCPVNENDIKPQVIFMGTFSDRINYKLLERLIKMFPKFKFCFFGVEECKITVNKQRFKRLITEDNVKYFGAIPYSDIEPYLLSSKLAIAPYKTNRIHNQLNSLKIVQYLSFGLSVVSTPFDDYKEAMNEGLLYMTSDESEFIEACDRILNSKINKKDIEKRVKYSEKYLYSSLLKKINNFINQKT